MGISYKVLSVVLFFKAVKKLGKVLYWNIKGEFKHGIRPEREQPGIIRESED